MSHQSVSWAFKQPVGHSPAKLVLVAMAHHVSNAAEQWTCWVSVTALAEMTGQDRKTVIANIKRLLALGFISDTGERVGETKSVTVFKLSGIEILNPKQYQKRHLSAVPDPVQLSGTSSGTATPSEAVPVLTISSPETGTAIEGKQYQKPPEAVPVFPTEQVEQVLKDKDIKICPASDSTPPTKKAKRGTRIPDDWKLTKKLGEFAREKCPTWTDDQIREMGESFHDHWIAATGQSASKLDWDAAWRTWVRKAIQFGQGASTAKPGFAADQRDEWWKSDAGIDRKGRELGLFPRGNENYHAYKDRIFDELKRRDSGNRGVA